MDTPHVPSRIFIAKKVSIGYKVTSEQGRIYGNPVADGWAGALAQKPFVIQ